MEFSRESLVQGLRNQEASAETPDSFATSDGAAMPRNTSPLDKANTRMAGQMGAFALQMMNDPNAKAVNDAWMARFGMSNQGMEFNQAKMMMSQPAQPQQEQQPTENK